MAEVEMITIPKAEYDDLIDQSNWLSCLEMAGVDNWEGCDFASDIFREKYPESADL